MANVPHILVERAPAAAESLFSLKMVAKIKAAVTPSPGMMPRKIPSAAPAATLCGESSMRKKCSKNFLILFINLFILRK